MAIKEEEIFVGPALSCVNRADGQLGRSIPSSLRYYIHDLRVALSSPSYMLELQPEQLWVEYEREGDRFLPRLNSWNNILNNIEIMHEFTDMPRILGVHAPNLKVDILDLSYDCFKKRQSIACIIEAMRWANYIKADYFVFHLCQIDRWVDDNYREFVLMPESLRIFNNLATVYLKEGFTFVPCIEILEFPKYPSTPQEVSNILKSCQAMLPETKLVFDISHLWRSHALIRETRNEGLESVRFNRFGQIVKDTLDLLKPGDVYLWHLGGCWQTETHLVPGIYPDEDPMNAFYRLDVPAELYNEGFEMNISEAFDLALDYCFKSNQPFRLILEIFEKDFNIILKAIKEVRNALVQKVKRK